MSLSYQEFLRQYSYEFPGPKFMKRASAGWKRYKNYNTNQQGGNIRNVLNLRNRRYKGPVISETFNVQSGLNFVDKQKFEDYQILQESIDWLLFLFEGKAEIYPNVIKYVSKGEDIQTFENRYAFLFQVSTRIVMTLNELIKFSQTPEKYKFVPMIIEEIIPLIIKAEKLLFEWKKHSANLIQVYKNLQRAGYLKCDHQSQILQEMLNMTEIIINDYANTISKEDLIQIFASFYKISFDEFMDDFGDGVQITKHPYYIKQFEIPHDLNIIIMLNTKAKTWFEKLNSSTRCLNTSLAPIRETLKIIRNLKCVNEITYGQGRMDITQNLDVALKQIRCSCGDNSSCQDEFI